MHPLNKRLIEQYQVRIIQLEEKKEDVSGEIETLKALIEELSKDVI